MLRRLDVTTQWRSLTPGFWPSDVPLGRATVVYGHNGSGKSTLAEALLSIANAEAATGMVWEQDDTRKVSVAAGSGGPLPSMAVFTRKWVESNLTEFLEGESADAIVTLGEAAIGAKEKEKDLEDEIERLRDTAKKAGDARGKAEKKVEALAREVQDRIIDELQRFDYSHYTRGRYTVTRVGDLLRQPRPEFPTVADHAEALVRLGEPEPSPVPTLKDPPTGLAEEIEALPLLLSRTPTRVALTALEAEPRVQSWVEQGRALHEHRDSCLFCSGALTDARREELSRHFDESWLQIRGEAKQLLAVMSARKSELTSWAESLPDPSTIVSDLQGAYQTARAEALRDVDRRLESLQLVEAVLADKVSDPSATPALPSVEVLATPVTATVLYEAVEQHNDQVQRHQELTTERKTIVFDHIVVTEDGKSYACRRGDEAGTNLSEGERTTLSLLYFLRNLEDQQVRGLDPAQRIVVIDDPSSSLDREALFATHQWLVTTLKKFGQYVVLTHDFNLLRLFITSHRSKWGDSAKAIGDGNPDEVRFPRVAFREMYAATAGGKRITKVGELPSLLRNSTTEYAYLFSMVMKGIELPADHERLFLLPNAARRVLEVFASYKAPHRPNFLQQLEWLVQAQPDEPYRAVYDFCNRFSHGEGGETVEVLDARAVHGDIRRCMEFLRSVDAEHFANMCQAVKIDPATLA